MKKITLSVDGMMCGMCEAHVNNAVRKAATVSKVTSSHSTGKTEIWYEGDVDVEAIKSAVSEEGYKVPEVKEGEEEKKGFFAKMFGKKD